MPQGHLRKVHEYEVTRGANGAPMARIVAVRPLVRFVQSGLPPVQWQEGKWMDDSGNLLDEAKVPEAYREHVRLHPPKINLGDDLPLMLQRCEFCSRFDIPSNEYAQHLADEHIKPALTGSKPAAPVVADPSAYQTTPDGTIKTDRSGRPKRKIGRPRKAA